MQGLMVVGAALLVAAGLAGCNIPAPSATLPVATTQAAGTVASVLTVMAATSPAATSATATGPTGATSSPPGSSSPAAATCTNQATFVSDVTVRDNTSIAPGEPFVKIWRLSNSGTCTWTPQYALVFFGGEQVTTAASFPLDSSVAPGMEIDLTVDMLAPSAAGTYQSFWKLRDGAGNLFGIGPQGDQAFWVKIEVASTARTTPSPTPIPTQPPTPAVSASATIALGLPASVDLDSGIVDPQSGADLTLSETTPGVFDLASANGALMARYFPPPDIPNPALCSALPLDAEATPLDDLSAGDLLCYRTDLAHPGYLEILAIDATVTLRFTTWDE